MMDERIALTKADKRQLEKLQISCAEIQRQFQRLHHHQPTLKLLAPARLGDGILDLSALEHDRLRQVYRHYLSQTKETICKFVPASGAATRMFDFLAAFYHDQKDASDPMVKQFFANLKQFPFYPMLKQRLGSYLNSQSEKELAKAVLYGHKLADTPKALLPFHVHKDQIRTALHEHVAELFAYAQPLAPQESRIHLTISPKYSLAFSELLLQIQREFGQGCTFTLSCQFPYTDTISLDAHDRLLRQANGSLLLRPGGHGALLQNLGTLKEDLIFIKNIDNVSHPDSSATALREKEVLGGLILEIDRLRCQILLALGSEETWTDGLQKEIQAAVKSWPHIFPSDLLSKGTLNKAAMVAHLDRPLRVCGMVLNQGEPGGGPFWVSGPDGQRSLQIVERTQLDTNDADQLAIFGQSTHFNPVDLVCRIKDAHGQPYRLSKFLDAHSDFVANKKHQGQPIRVLEHPGLWNGSMAHWLTLFVEVHADSFTPVKTINDLLRSAHQPGKNK